MTHTPRTWAAVLAIAVLFGGSVSAQPKSKNNEPPGGASRYNSKIVDLFKTSVNKSADSTVAVLVDGKQAALGTVIKDDGYILTKDSELRSDKIAVKFRDGKELPAKKISTNETWDLAMLKVDTKGLKPIVWADSKVAPVGNWVATTAPADRPISIGVVSVASRSMPPGPKIPLPKNNNERGYLGIQMEDADTLDGVKIVEVSPKSPAEKAGFMKNDVIIAVDGKDTLDLQTLGATIGRHKPGETITIRFRRGEKEDEAKATLEKRPAGLGFDRGDMQNSMGTDRSERRTGFPVTLQHDTDLKASQCGGPLVDLDGNVIGINIARGGRTDTYAIPSENVRPLLPDLLAAKSIPVKTISPLLEKIREARDLLKKAEEEKTAADKKVADAKAALEKLLEEQKKEKK